MSLFTSPVVRAADANNSSLAGAQWYFYLTGTTTPASVYTTSARTVAHANPVVADAGGLFAPIYLDPMVVYRAVLKTAAGTVVQDIDPIDIPEADEIRAQLPGMPYYNTTMGDALPYINPSAFFGIASDGTTDDTARITAAIEAIGNNTSGFGGILRMKQGAITKTTDEIILRPGVRLDLQGGHLRAALSGEIPSGVVLMSHAEIANGKVSVISSYVGTGSLGTQSGIHAPIRVGPLYSYGGTVAAPSELEFAHNWVIRNLVLASDKRVETSPGSGIYTGAAAIQILGGCHSGRIQNIYIPDSDRLYGGVMMDWGFLGSISSDETQMDANKTAYLAGTAKTTHPSNIDVDGLYIGRLTAANQGVDSGSFGVRLSGCQGVSVKNVFIDYVTSAAAMATAGDLGFEFADADVRQNGMDGSIFRNITVLEPLVGNAAGGGAGGYLGYFDSYADNIARAVAVAGYTAMTDPLIYAGLTVDGLRGHGDGSANAQYGIRAINCWGAEIVRCVAKEFRSGIIIDELTRQVTVSKSVVTENREHGIVIQHNTSPPEDSEIFENTVHSNGTGGGSNANIYLATSKRCRVYNNILGVEGANDPYATWNIRAVDNPEDAEVWGNTHLSTSAAGVAESVLSDLAADYGKIARWEGGLMADPTYIATERAGLPLVPVDYRTDSDGVRRATYRAASTALTAGAPTNGTYVAGEVIEVESTGERRRCTASGTPGTWTA